MNSSWIIIFWIVKTSYSWTKSKYNWEFHVEDCEEQKSHMSGVLLSENYLHGRSFNSHLSHPDFICFSLRVMKSFKFKRKGFENYTPWAFCHWKFLTLSFLLILREDMKTWHCNCPRVSSGATATCLPPWHWKCRCPIRSHSLATTSLMLWDNLKVLITANMPYPSMQPKRHQPGFQW